MWLILFRLVFLFLAAPSLKAKLYLVCLSVRFLLNVVYAFAFCCKYYFLEFSLTNILILYFYFFKMSPKDLIVCSGNMSMFSLNINGHIFQHISSSLNLDLFTICSTCFSVMTVSTMPLYLLISAYWVRIVLSIYYFYFSY